MWITLKGGGFMIPDKQDSHKRIWIINRPLEGEENGRNQKIIRGKAIYTIA